MTDRRRERVTRAARRDEPAPQLGQVATYWLTRDSDADGRLSEAVDVWLVRPVRRSLGEQGAYWIVEDDSVRVSTDKGDVPARFATWTIPETLITCRTLPDDDRMCIRVGDDEPVLAK